MFDANGGAEKDCKQQSKDCLVKVEGNYWGDVRHEHTNKVERQSIQDGYKTGHAMVYGAECWAVTKKEERKLHTTEMQMMRWPGKRKDETISCQKCRHLERGTHVPDDRIPQREDVEMVWTCANAR